MAKTIPRNNPMRLPNRVLSGIRLSLSSVRIVNRAKTTPPRSPQRPACEDGLHRVARVYPLRPQRMSKSKRRTHEPNVIHLLSIHFCRDHTGGERGTLSPLRMVGSVVKKRGECSSGWTTHCPKLLCQKYDASLSRSRFPLRSEQWPVLSPRRSSLCPGSFVPQKRALSRFAEDGDPG